MGHSETLGLSLAGEPGIAPAPQEGLRPGIEIRFANLEIDGPAVADLYVEPSIIEHLADVRPDGESYVNPETGEKEVVTPESRLNQLKEYYRIHPNSTLIVAATPGEGIVGAITVSREEDLPRSGKFNRLVVKESHRRQHTAQQLLRKALAYAFSSGELGGLGYEQVQLGVIQDVEGNERAVKAFEQVGFDYFGGRLHRRCDSWSNSEKRMVPRDVRQMMLQRVTYVIRYGRDLGKNFPSPPPLGTN